MIHPVSQLTPSRLRLPAFALCGVTVLSLVGCSEPDSATSESALDAGTKSDSGSVVPGPEGPGPSGTLPARFDWTSTGPLVTAVADAQHPILSVKDPSVVFFEDKWHVFATTADENAQWSLVYLNFSDWSEAADAELHYLDENPALRGYHAAPQVFYFSPHDKWYLIFQSGQPQYSTTSDLSDPASWSAPTNFFPAQPSIVTENAGTGGWLDFWVICDDDNCHLFFTDDNGQLYRSETSMDDFPEEFGDPVIAIDGTKSTVFEGSATYKVGADGGYLTLVEAFGSIGERYYRSFVSDTLDGEWTPWAASLENPFAATSNVTFANDDAWTNDISHGELLRDGFDESLTIDPTNLRMLYQGVEPSQTGGEYFSLPYQLALLTYTSTPTAGPDPVASGPSVCESTTRDAVASIADFDDGATTGFWDSYDETTNATHEPLATEAPGANGTAMALHFTGTGYMSWGANFGTTPGCTDTSLFDGFSFYAKGTSAAASSLDVILQVPEALPVSAGGDCTADCYSHPSTTIRLTPEWTRYDLPFSDFVYPGWGVMTEYHGTVMGFVFGSTGPDFDVWVDELRLFSRDASLPDAGAPASNRDAGRSDSGLASPLADSGLDDMSLSDGGSSDGGSVAASDAGL